MSSDKLRGVRLFMVAAICQTLANCDLTSPITSSGDQNSTTIDVKIYKVVDGGSCPLMSGVGDAILSALTDAPDDASVLEGYILNPNYDYLKLAISTRHKSVGSFITCLWVLLVIFAIYAAFTLLGTVMCMLKVSNCDFNQVVTSKYMTYYLAYVISLIVLLIVSVYFLICLLGTQSSASVALDNELPFLYSQSFKNLRLYVKMTVDQIAETRKKADAITNAKSLFGSGFRVAFRNFVSDNAMADVRAPLYNMAGDCANDFHFLGRLFKSEGLPQFGVSFRTLGDQCAHIHKGHEELFDNVARVVAQATRANRRHLVEILGDASSMLDASDSDVKPSMNSIDALENVVSGFETNNGLYDYFASTLMMELLVLVIWFFVALVLLEICLLMGIAVHRRSIAPHMRTPLSHFLGYMIVATAFLFSVFVIMAIGTVIRLTVYDTLGECHFCTPYKQLDYTVLDDAFERLWPPSNRSHLLSKLTPSEVFHKCSNESVSIFDLGPEPAHRRNLNYHDVSLPTVDAQVVLQKLFDNVKAPESTNHMDLFRKILSSLKNVTLKHGRHFKRVQSAAKNLFDKWSGFWRRRNIPRLNRTAIEWVLVPMVPVYFKRFVEQVTEKIESTYTVKSSVIGPCYIVHDMLLSLLDVVCRRFVTDLVGHWATLLCAVLAAILIVWFSYSLSDYFFRTYKRRVRVLKAPRRKSSPIKRLQPQRKLQPKEVSRSSQGAEPVERYISYAPEREREISTSEFVSDSSEMSSDVTRKVVICSSSASTMFHPPQRPLARGAPYSYIPMQIPPYDLPSLRPMVLHRPSMAPAMVPMMYVRPPLFSSQQVSYSSSSLSLHRMSSTTLVQSGQQTYSCARMSQAHLQPLLQTAPHPTSPPPHRSSSLTLIQPSCQTLPCTRIVSPVQPIPPQQPVLHRTTSSPSLHSVVSPNLGHPCLLTVSQTQMMPSVNAVTWSPSSTAPPPPPPPPPPPLPPSPRAYAYTTRTVPQTHVVPSVHPITWCPSSPPLLQPSPQSYTSTRTASQTLVVPSVQPVMLCPSSPPLLRRMSSLTVIDGSGGGTACTTPGSQFLPSAASLVTYAASSPLQTVGSVVTPPQTIIPQATQSQVSVNQRAYFGDARSP